VNAIFEERLKASGFAKPEGVEVDAGIFVQAHGPEFAAMRAVRGSANWGQAVPPAGTPQGTRLFFSMGEIGTVALWD
jgi:hypothetical protein